MLICVSNSKKLFAALLGQILIISLHLLHSQGRPHPNLIMSLEKKLVYSWVAEIDGSDTSAIFEEIRNPAICEFKTFILSEVGDFQIWIERFEDIILLTNMYWYRFYKAGPYNKEGITDIYNVM